MTNQCSDLELEDRLLEMSRLAYRVGMEQKTKTNISKNELFSRVMIFNVRHYYKRMIWASYKAGRFTAFACDN